NPHTLALDPGSGRGSALRRMTMKLPCSKVMLALMVSCSVLIGVGFAYSQQVRGTTSYMPVDIKEPFASTMAHMKAAKADVEKEHSALLGERYDLSNRPVKD